MKRAPITGPVNYRIEKVSFLMCRENATTIVRPALSVPAEVYAVARELIPDDAREHFIALYLNSQNYLIAAHEVSVGTLSESLVHPREVFGPALRLLGVASIILLHNHPSGDTTPSKEDLRITRQLVECAKFLDLRIHDHVILGNGSGQWTSFAEKGLL